MIIGLVGGDPRLNEQLGEFLRDQYDVQPLSSTNELDDRPSGDYVLTTVDNATEAQWLHDEMGARLVHLKHPSNRNLDEALTDLCSVSVDCAGGFSRAREKLEMALTGCC
jgi:hypothetical protein